MIELQTLADELGIARDYIDSSFEYKVINPECRVLALKTLGFNIDNEEILESQVKNYKEDFYVNMLKPVTVIRAGEKPFIYIATKEDLTEDAIFSYEIITEDGKRYVDSYPLYEVEIARYLDVYGTTYDVRRFIMQEQLDFGYHKFSCTVTDGNIIYHSREMSLIITPKVCYMPDEIKAGKKLWGVSTQLYSLRSETNWGIGDFGDLKELLKNVARSGGGFVGLNPLHASYPSNPDPDIVSPYSPSSRKWLNVVYINVLNVVDLKHSKAALDLINSSDFQQKLQNLRDLEYVNYREVLNLKLQALKLIFNDFMQQDQHLKRMVAFKKFITAGGESLKRLATFDALQEFLFKKGVNAWGWPAFSPEYHDVNSFFVQDFAKAHEQEVLFFSYLQFLAQEQLEQAQQEVAKGNMPLGIYRDLAVGVSFGSCDVWGDDKDVYSRDGASIGAPPDNLGPKGQSWGLSPINPIALYNSAYEEFIGLYRANMRSCGALRIDHAAGLYRYWVVPANKEATEGVYIKSKLHDLLGIIALESHRNKCLIIAEDLGTIPQELRDGLKESGMFSYKLFFGERANDGGFIAPRDYEKQAMSALTTHDMPTLVGWWSLSDLSLGVKLGIYTQEQADKLAVDRQEAKQRILDSLHGLGSVGDDVPRDVKSCQLTEALAFGMQVHMCRGSCALYSTQIEDWIGVTKPVNIPGTYKEYPNWRRKLTKNIDEIFGDPKVQKLTELMTKARNA